MRRPLNIALGVLEILVALVLGAFVFQLPGPDDVADKVGRIEKVGLESTQQVAGLREQLEKVRRRQPRARQLAAQLSDRVDKLNVQERDYDTATEHLANALVQAANDIDNASKRLDGTLLNQFAAGLAQTAELLDKQLAPAATVTGGRLEESARNLRGDVRRLTKLWDEAPPDVQIARSVTQVLGQFDEGLAAVSERLDENRVQVLMVEMKSMELALLSAADTADRLGSMSNPLDAFSLSAITSQRPSGRKASSRRCVCGRWPRPSTSRRTNSASRPRYCLRSEPGSMPAVPRPPMCRRDLGNVIRRRLSDDPHLRNTPLQVATTADEILTIGEELGRLLRQTNQLRETAARLRQVRAGTIEADRGLQQLRTSLGDFANLLRWFETNLRQGAFRSSLGQTLIVLTAFVEALPVLTDSLETELEEQDQSLGRLEDSVKHLTSTLPEGGRTAARLIQMTRVLMLLMGSISLLHGAFLIMSSVTTTKQEKTQ